jgi:hypothetical protein
MAPAGMLDVVWRATGGARAARGLRSLGMLRSPRLFFPDCAAEIVAEGPGVSPLAMVPRPFAVVK